MLEHSRNGHSECDGETALDTARRAFDFLVTGPYPISLDHRDVPGLPAAAMPLDQVRDLVLQQRCSQALRDRIWRHLAIRSRTEGGTWTVACTGMALPALVTMATRLAAHRCLDTVDLDAAVLAGFLDGLADLDLDRAGIMNRLRWTAYRSGHAMLRDAIAAPIPETAIADGAVPPRSLAAPHDGHPDLVLARAVADGVLASHEADLIATTRLDKRSLVRVADEHSASYDALKKTRARAEQRLAKHLAGLQHHPPPRPRPSQSPPVTGGGIAARSSGLRPGREGTPAKARGLLPARAVSEVE